jgi:uncharacterized protein YndB with AHSA1/START domain
MAEPPIPEGLREGIAMTRIFDAARERVWAEWTEPAPFADWFGGGEAEVPLESVAMDVRPGGRWRATMFAGPGRTEIQWKGSYREVVEPERLVFTISDQPDDDAFELIIVVFSDLGDGRTEMHFQQLGRMAAEQYKGAESGWSKFFDRMDEHLTRL